MSIDWGEVTAIATALSGLALVGSAILIVAQLARQAQEQFVSSTTSLFDIWEDEDFRNALLSVPIITWAS